jgi:transposase
MRKYFKRWYFWATHSRLEPMKKVAKTVKAHIDNIVTYARHRITNAPGRGDQRQDRESKEDGLRVS